MFVGNPGARREPAVFVEFPVVGNVGLGNHAQHTPLREDHGAVVERRPVAQRGARDQREGQFARGAHQALQRLVGRVEQRLLQQEVAAGVGRDAQLGEHHDLDASPGGLFGHRRHPFGVVVAVGDPHVRNGRRYLEKTEIVHKRSVVRSQPVRRRSSVAACSRGVPPRFQIRPAPEPPPQAGACRNATGFCPDCRRSSLNHLSFIWPKELPGSGSPAAPCASS